MRTEKGPQKSWLHKIGKSDSATCQCGHPNQTGLHITFHCPKWTATRTQLIGDRKKWEDLDDPIWIQTGQHKEDIFDAVEEWFGYIFGFLA